MSSKVSMIISSNRNQVNNIPIMSRNTASGMMPVSSNGFRVKQNNQENNQDLAMNLAQINKSKGCGCGGTK